MLHEPVGGRILDLFTDLMIDRWKRTSTRRVRFVFFLPKQIETCHLDEQTHLATKVVIIQSRLLRREIHFELTRW